MVKIATTRECQSCGATNVGEHDHCLLCQALLTSAQVEPQVQQTQLTERRCSNPDCGQIVPDGKKFCTACGSPVIQSGAGVTVASNGEQRCSNPDCAQVVPEGKKFCTACGAPVKTEVRETVAPESVERRCLNPECGQLVPEDKTFCTACGTRLS